MPTALPNLKYVAGSGYNAGVACSLPIFSAPFPGVNIDYVLKQDYICASPRTLLDLNTVHGDYSDFLLCAEDEERNLEGGMVRWTRTYAKIPATYSQPTGTVYNYIGYLTSDSPAIVGRARFNRAAAGRIQYDYFILDKTAGDIRDADGNVVFSGTAGVLPSLADVPLLQVQKYFDSGINSVKLGVEADSISYGPGAASPQTNYPVPDGTSAQPPYAAYPTREVYESWRDRTATVVTYDPDTNTSTDTGLYEIVAIASQCSRWLGNIIERQTIYIRPQ